MDGRTVEQAEEIWTFVEELPKSVDHDSFEKGMSETNLDRVGYGEHSTRKVSNIEDL